MMEGFYQWNCVWGWLVFLSKCYENKLLDVLLENATMAKFHRLWTYELVAPNYRYVIETSIICLRKRLTMTNQFDAETLTEQDD